MSWNSKDCLLYAVGIGAGQADLAFTTENSIGIDQQVFPTFAVVAGSGSSSGGSSALSKIGDFNPAMLVHGTQSVTLHQPIPVSATVQSNDRIVAMHDKGKAAVVVYATDVTLDGAPLWTTTSSMFIRGEGGWGGDRGPSGPQNVPPDAEPDHVVELQTGPDQAFVYRLSGDRNPLHVDPQFAALGGFDRPILHGLCTYGFTGRALLGSLCGNEASKFHHIEGRFSSPVLPGDLLTVRIWRTGDGEALFTTSVGDRAVIDQGLARYS